MASSRPEETHGSGAGGGGPLPAAAALIVGALAVGLAVDAALAGVPGLGTPTLEAGGGLAAAGCLVDPGT